MPDVVELNLNTENLRFDPLYTHWTGVRYVSGNTQIAFAGNDSGRVLEIECPWGSQEMAEAALARIRHVDYQPFSADNALIDPAAEPGDTALISGAACPVVSMDAAFDGLFSADLSAPGEEAINRDYPLPDPVRTVVQQEIAQALNDPDNLPEPMEEVEQNIDDMQDDIDELESNVDQIQDDVNELEDDVEQIQNTLDSPEILGPITTEALYALYGDFADLTVDRLYTTRRIPRFLRGDTSDDNHIKIEGERIQFVAGICNSAANPVQAENFYGLPLYWKSNPNAEGCSLGSNGYPLDADGKPIYTTTDQTDWPVMVYVYEEQVKREIAFSLERAGTASTAPIYSVMDTYGAGNAQGTNIAKILKGTEGFDLTYTPVRGDPVGFSCTTDGRLVFHGSNINTKFSLDGDDENAFLSYDAAGTVEFLRVQPQNDDSGGNSGNDSDSENDSTPVYTPPSAAGLRMDSSGYADLVGARRSTHIDFSNIHNGSFSETVDGDSTEYVYNVEFDDDDRPVKITAFDGHECLITWPED